MKVEGFVVPGRHLTSVLVYEIVIGGIGIPDKDEIPNTRPVLQGRQSVDRCLNSGLLILWPVGSDLPVGF